MCTENEKTTDGVDHKSELTGSLASLVPTTWLDPLLTGANKILPDGSSFGFKDIERLLRAIKKRIAEPTML